MPRLPDFSLFLLFFAAATACAGQPAEPANAEIPSFDSSTCSKIDYPHEAMRRGEQASPCSRSWSVTMAACGAELLDSSGCAALGVPQQAATAPQHSSLGSTMGPVLW